MTKLSIDDNFMKVHMKTDEYNVWCIQFVLDATIPGVIILTLNVIFKGL